MNQIDDESLGWMILLAAVNSSPQSAQSGIEWDVSIVHKSSMMPGTCFNYKWENARMSCNSCFFLAPNEGQKSMIMTITTTKTSSNLNDSDKSNHTLFELHAIFSEK